jgi:hypothetical protein
LDREHNPERVYDRCLINEIEKPQITHFHELITKKLKKKNPTRTKMTLGTVLGTTRWW